MATLVRVLDGVSGPEPFGVAPFDSAFTGGVYNAVKNLDGDAKGDLVVGDGAVSRVTGYLGKYFAGGVAPEAFAFDAFPGSAGGVFVG